MREIDKLGREAFDIRWVTTGIRIAVNGTPAMTPLASIAIGSGEERTKILVPTVDFPLLQAFLEDM